MYIPKGLRSRWRQDRREDSLGIGESRGAVSKLLTDQQLGARLKLSDRSGATRVKLLICVGHALRERLTYDTTE
jgi:hypothetical protein